MLCPLTVSYGTALFSAAAAAATTGWAASASLFTMLAGHLSNVFTRFQYAVVRLVSGHSFLASMKVYPVRNEHYAVLGWLTWPNN